MVAIEKETLNIEVEEEEEMMAMMMVGAEGEGETVKVAHTIDTMIIDQEDGIESHMTMMSIDIVDIVEGGVEAAAGGGEGEGAQVSRPK